jgi:ring-1,2-phenylacetyl-CoA epoxidase subunit PaaE
VATILAAEPDSRVTLLFGNRRPASAMLLDQLKELQRQVGARLDLHLVYSQADVEDCGRPGRIDWGRVITALPDAPTGVDEWFMCGPEELMQALGQALADRRVPARRVHAELFAASSAGGLSAAELVDVDSTVTLKLDNELTKFELNGRGEPILAAGLRLRSDLPYACRSGLCGTCRARLTEGEVVMERCSALDLEDRRAGYVLACVGHPVTERVTLDFDG